MQDTHSSVLAQSLLKLQFNRAFTFTMAILPTICIHYETKSFFYFLLTLNSVLCILYACMRTGATTLFIFSSSQLRVPQV